MDGYRSLLKSMLHIYTEKFSLQSCYFYGINKVLCKKKDAHRNISLPSDHSELGVSLRRKKATCSEYQKIPKDPEGCAEQQSKSEIPPLVFLVSFPSFFSLFSHFNIHNIFDVSFSFRSTSTCSLHNCFLFQKTCSSISFFSLVEVQWTLP